MPSSSITSANYNTKLQVPHFLGTPSRIFENLSINKDGEIKVSGVDFSQY